MFKSILNYDPSTYEAIIAAFIVLGLIQSFALRAKWQQAEKLKGDIQKVAVAATKAIFASLTGGFKALAKAEQRARVAEARADEAENTVRAMMQAQADADDEADEATRGDRNPFTGRNDVQTLFFGDTHFGDDKSRQLRDLFSLLDGPGRNRGALDDLIFGRRGPGVHVVNGGDFLGDGPYTNNRAPEAAVVESALGLPPGSVSHIEVHNVDGSPVSAAEREMVLKEFCGPRPSFDPLHIDPLAFGTQVHENIERAIGDHPDESCSTQEPRSYPTSSPRAG